jgi:TolB-like protein/DNA-binding winged helix-turn-helix (wHTH) protein
MQSKRLQFGRYVLDLDRGCLFHEDKEVALRPKTFAVLLYLVENPRRLVSKDELFAAVWPKVAVTDDALVQSVGELRRALGDHGHLIKTVPRRGYRFEWDLSSDASTHSAQIPAAAGTDAPAKEARSRLRMVGAIACVLVLLAGAFWIGAGSERKLASGTEKTDRSTTRRLESSAKPGIAFIPLVNQGDDFTREHFVDGLTQDIISAMGRFSELTVMSWNAVSPFKGKPASPGEIARELAVRYQVEGTVRQTGERVRVNARLVAAEGEVLWSGSYDEALTDLFTCKTKSPVRSPELWRSG